MLDAFETADSVLEDIEKGTISKTKGLTDDEVDSILQKTTGL